ncbi:MAG: hypothetical protein ACXAD7_07660 [Candidatus Kariarchaeaceae archaeon]|jgi:hypothetical protein
MPDQLRDLLDFKKIWLHLSEIALKDDIITSEEHLLITNFTHDAGRYLDIVDQALDDGIITGDERHMLFQARLQMMQNSVNIANSGNQITSDNFAILSSIKNILEIVEKLELDL